MGNVVSMFERNKKPALTPEERLKVYCMSALTDDQVTADMLQVMTIDEAFRFIANKAVEWGLIDEDGKRIPNGRWRD